MKPFTLARKLRVIVQPMVVWLWIGGGVMAFGTVLAAFPGKRRRGVAKGLAVVLTSLLLAADSLYAGTAEEGSIFRVGTAGPGVPKMVYDTPQAVITLEACSSSISAISKCSRVAYS